MARGNDPDAARELQEKYGTSGNAEDLINANRGRRDRTVTAASRLPVDEEASKKLKLSEIDAPGKVVDARVRGHYVSYIWEDEAGRMHRGAQVRKGLSKAEAAHAEETVGDDDPETVVARLHAEHRAELDRIQAEQDARIEKAVAKAREDATREAQKAADAANREAAKAARDAAKAAAKADSDG